MTKWKDDAGHGGSDSGAVNGSVYEKNYTLEASNYVTSRLKELGISVSQTRTSDIGMADRVRAGLMKPSNKGLTHHFNAGGGAGAEFIHSVHGNGAFERLLVDEFKKAGYPLRNTPIYTKQLNSNTPKKDWYYMHRDTDKCRVTIIEYDFLDGANASKLKDKKYREGMYECVVKAVCRDERVKYFPSKSVVNTKKSDTIYRVVTGSFSDLSNADLRVRQLKAVGFDSFIVQHSE